ncbi:MAG: response regulator [Bacteroidia bacterium]
MKTLKILLIDDYEMIRDGIRSMLESQEKKYKFTIYEAEDGDEGVSKAIDLSPHIIILDYELPKMSGAETAGTILANNPKAKILALSNYNEYMYIDKMIKAGVKGFILKNIGPEELLKAINTILNGNIYYSSDVALKLMNFDNNSYRNKKISKEYNHKLEKLLSHRELDVLKYIAEEYTSEEIGRKLHISKRTVDTHRQNIMKKLEVKSIAGVMKYTMPLISAANSSLNPDEK